MPKKHSGICRYCKKQFYKSRSESFCNKKCLVASRWTERECKRCGKAFKAMVCNVKQGRMGFCSRKCCEIASRTREDAIEFDGKRYIINANGYYSSSDGKQTLLAHDVWEKHHRIKVPRGMIIHHKNENKIDNRIDNLELKEWGEHTRDHNLGKRKPKTPCKIGGCQGYARAFGLCGRHYQADYKLRKQRERSIA